MSIVNEIRRTIHRFFNDEGASPFSLRRQFAETWPNKWRQYTVIVLSSHFQLGTRWMWAKPRSHATADTGSVSCNACSAGRACAQRMGGHTRRLRQCRDSATGLGIHHQPKLQRRFGRPQRPGPVRN